MKKKRVRLYCAPQCSLIRLDASEPLQVVSFNSPGASGGGSGHASAGDSGGLSAKQQLIFDAEEEENEEEGYTTGW